MREIHYINLTNGLEDYNPQYRFTRIQSSHCEQKDWEKVLWSLGDDLLMNLALGNHCIIHDYSPKRESPRAIWQGFAFIKYVLNRIWFGRTITCYSRSQVKMDNYFRWVYNKLKKSTLNRLKYYRKFLETGKLNLTYKTGKTLHDGDYLYFKSLLGGQKGEEL